VSQRTCAACDHPVNATDTICRACVSATRRHLANQTAYLADLETELARMTAKQPPNDGGKSSETPLPYSPVAGDLIAEQRAILSSWVRLMIEEDILRHTPADTIPAFAAALDTRMPEFRSHPAAGDFRLEIRNLSARIVKCIDLPEYRMRMVAGSCPEQYPDDNGVMSHCPGQVEMGIPHDRDLPGWLRCLVCKIDWPPGPQWYRAGSRIMARDEEIKRQALMARAFSKGAA
jgi:hypothetical protein